MTCLDCGQPTPEALDGPLCPDCAAVAVAVYGTVEQRIQQLQEADQ